MLLCFQILILTISFQLSQSFPYLPDIQYQLNNEKSDTSEVINAVQIILKDIINNTNSTSEISDECKVNLTHAFTCFQSNESICENYENESRFHTVKLISETSKNQNDITTYSQCLRKHNTKEIENYSMGVSYLVVIINKKNDLSPINATDLNLISHWSIFGLCLPKICNNPKRDQTTNKEPEIKEVIYYAANMFNKLLNLTDENDLEVYFVDQTTDQIKWSDYQMYLYLLPSTIITLQILITTTGCFPSNIFNGCCCCQKSKQHFNDLNKTENIIQIVDSSNFYFNNNSSFPLLPSNQNNAQSNSTGKAKTNKPNQFINISHTIKSLFNISDNGEELFNFQHTTELNNFSCLTCLSGIRGISMIFLIFGFLFFALFNSASSVCFEKQFINMMASPLFPIFYFGLRYSPKILLSCSGYSLLFKFVCFLDDEFDEVKDKKFLLFQEKKKEQQTKYISPNNAFNKDLNNNQITNKEKNIDLYDEFSENQYPEDIQLSFLIKFYLYQIHKYFLYVLMILCMQYSLHYLFLMINNPNPMWTFFEKKITGFNQTPIHMNTLKSIALLDPFLYQYNSKNETLYYYGKEYQSSYKYCWFVLCEFKYFALSTLMIFIGYKYKMRFDLFIIVLVILLFIAKIVLFSIMYSKNLHFSTLYYYFNDYGLINFGFIWNYIYFLLGILFGCINYVIQKDLSIKEVIMMEKRFLTRAAFIVKFFKEKRKQIVFALGLISLFIIVLFTIVIPCILYYKGIDYITNHLFELTKLQQSPALNYLMLIDGDVIVFLVQFAAFLFYIKGDNIIAKVLSHSIWVIFNKFYFSFILLLNPVILYVLYQTESRINLNIFNSILFSFTCAIIIFIFASVHYICLELPWKKVIKFIIKQKKR